MREILGGKFRESRKERKEQDGHFQLAIEFIKGILCQANLFFFDEAYHSKGMSEISLSFGCL